MNRFFISIDIPYVQNTTPYCILIPIQKFKFIIYGCMLSQRTLPHAETDQNLGTWRQKYRGLAGRIAVQAGRAPGFVTACFHLKRNRRHYIGVL